MAEREDGTMRQGDDGRDGTVETIEIAHPLRDRVARHTVGEAEALFRAAADAVAEQARGYLDHAREEHAAAAEAIRTAKDFPERRAEAFDRLYGIAHDIKGQGATFGYPLAAGICAGLCGLLAHRPRLDDTALRIAEAHVDALALVLDHALAGDGGEQGRVLLRRLRGLAARAGGD